MLTGSHGLSISRNEPTRPEQLPTQADEISVPKTSKKSTVPANQSHSGMYEIIGLTYYLVYHIYLFTVVVYTM